MIMANELRESSIGFSSPINCLYRWTKQRQDCARPSLCLLIQTFPRPEASKNTSIFLFKQYHVVFVSVFFSLLVKLKHI